MLYFIISSSNSFFLEKLIYNMFNRLKLNTTKKQSSNADVCLCDIFYLFLCTNGAIANTTAIISAPKL